ncbi:MAG TPA: biopolymer transporter ExbD [Bryobacteraceae bacterium]|nr:biopolymer transporter ExbD [Bryobacteraceae bacterium]
MSITVNGGGGGGLGSRRRGSSGTLSEINVTPFVDVVLVLLIIFMLTAHVMEFGIEIDVPKVTTGQQTSKELPVVTVSKDGLTELNGKPVNIHDLADTIHRNFTHTDAVYLRADKDVVWDIPVQVMSVLGQAKFQVNVVTEPLEEGPRGVK